MLCFFSSWCCGWQWFFNADHCYWRLSFDALGLLGCVSFFWWFSFGALGLLLSLFQVPSADSAHGLCCVLRFRSSSSSSSSSSFFLFLFPFLPLLGFLFLWLSVFSVVSFLLPLPLAFPCAWFGRPLLTSFCCCSCFVLNCAGLVVVVAALAVAEAGVLVVVGVCSPLVCGQRLFAGVVVVGVCSPLVLVWLVGGGVCSPVVAPCLLAG